MKTYSTCQIKFLRHETARMIFSFSFNAIVGNDANVAHSGRSDFPKLGRRASWRKHRYFSSLGCRVVSVIARNSKAMLWCAPKCSHTCIQLLVELVTGTRFTRLGSNSIWNKNFMIIVYKLVDQESIRWSFTFNIFNPLLVLSGSQWEACFHKVLFPLLTQIF